MILLLGSARRWGPSTDWPCIGNVDRSTSKEEKKKANPQERLASIGNEQKRENLPQGSQEDKKEEQLEQEGSLSLSSLFTITSLL